MTNLIPKHGGYRKLLSFQISHVFDVTVRFLSAILTDLVVREIRWSRQREAWFKRN